MRTRIEAALPVVLALLASLSVLLNLTLIGPMAWHFRQPSTVQGGLEAVVMMLALATLAAHGRRWCWFAAAVVLGFYLRRHHVDLPLLLMLLVVEG